MVSLTAPVSRLLSPRGPCSMAQCHHHHTVLHAWHSAAAQPRGVTVHGVTWCHCHCTLHGVSLLLPGHGVPHSVTAAPMGCHTESLSLPGARVSHSAMSLHGPRVSPGLTSPPSRSASHSVAASAWPAGVTQHCCHCVAWGCHAVPLGSAMAAPLHVL